jgi:hypothetical protein
MIRRALTLAAAVIAAVLLSAAPAWAHGGPIALDVHSDGGQGITATVTYQRDGHYVTGEVEMTYTAISDKGRTVGPLPLKASAEGQSFYVSKDKLPLGNWTVTVSASHPSTASKTISLTSAKLPPVSAPAPASSGGSITTLVAIPVAIAVVALAVALVLRRRRQARLTVNA